MSMDDTAATVMTRNIIAVGPGDTVPQIAALLSKHDISAAPVLDNEGKLLGMVSEGDLMRPFTAGNSAKRAWWLNMLAEGEDLAPEFMEYIRQDRRTANDLMTREVVTASEDTKLAEIAELLDKHHIKRVAILRDGRLTGIVSRADIVRALATTQQSAN